MTMRIVIFSLALAGFACAAAKTEAKKDGLDAATADVPGDATATADGGADAAPADVAADTVGEIVVAPRPYKATIRWTAYGVPHIVADDYGNLGFGQGYAFARDNICTLADQIVKVRSERAAYFGAGQGEANVTSDLGYLALQVVDFAKTVWSTMSADGRELVAGYAAGYNHRLAQAGPGGLPLACRNMPWVKPISAIDLLAYYQDLALYASGRQLRAYLARTVVPKSTARFEAPSWPRILEQALPLPRQIAELARNLPDFQSLDIGSNGWAIGAERSAGGKGMLLANPHFPWVGELKLWESHLTIPGKLDVAGAALYGVAGVLIGHNQHVAWTHTVSASRRFNAYRLKLDPKDPTTYLVDGVPHKMSMHTGTIQVKGTDGKMTSIQQDFYRTDFGPVAQVPAVGEWTSEQAFALRDGNEANGGLIDHWLGLAKTKSIAEVEQVLGSIQANPWTNTMATDDQGQVLFSDCNSTPNLSAQAMAEYEKVLKDGSDIAVTLTAQQGVVLLDGSKSANDWVVEPGSRRPGLTPFAKTPHMQRTDYVFNANDSHWLSNPAQPLEGFSHMYGAEKSQRSARTRLNAQMLAEKTVDGASGTDGKFTFQELQDVVMNDRAWVAENLLADLVKRCTGQTEVTWTLAKDGSLCQPDAKDATCKTAPPQTFDIAAGCKVLAQWDGRLLPASKGAVLFREWLSYTPKFLYLYPFDAKNPLTTPNTLLGVPAQGPDPALIGIALAAQSLQAANLPLDVAVGDAQFTKKGDKRFAIHGGNNTEGAFNIIGWASADDTLLKPPFFAMPYAGKSGSLRKDGYPVNNGSSFMMIVEFTAQGPHAVALLSYAQASDADSKHWSDQTQHFADRKFRPMPFTDAEIKADPTLTVQTVEQP